MPNCPRRARVHDDLVGTARIGEPTTLERHAIHLREHAVEAPTDVRRGTARRQMNLVAVERRDVGIDDREVCDLLHEGQPRDLCDQPRVVGDVAHARRVERGNDSQGVGIDVPQVRGKRRLRAPRPRDGADRQPADQPNQQHDREQAAPSAPERRAEPIPSDPPRLDHRVPPRSDTHGDPYLRHARLAHPGESDHALGADQGGQPTR